MDSVEMEALHSSQHPGGRLIILIIHEHHGESQELNFKLNDFKV